MNGNLLIAGDMEQRLGQFPLAGGQDAGRLVLCGVVPQGDGRLAGGAPSLFIR